MHYRKSHLLVLLVCAMALGWIADYDYPKDYFVSPVDREILLSGTFGELRSNHFHAGIDIKSTNGQSGEDVFAAAKGYVARIKVQSGGYGNALYIRHPNGYTTVYAHLDDFIPTIAEYVKQKQYKFQRFSVDLYPEPGDFPIEKHQLIGHLGNTGSSFGPHLHFEVRSSADQVPINPLHFGFSVKDQTPPAIRNLNVYLLDEDRNVYESITPDVLRIREGEYRLKDTLLIPAWRASFALRTDDRISNTTNKNGIYKLDLSVDGASQFAFKMDRVSFGETRYLNAHIDYGAKQLGMGSYHRCFRLPGNKLNLYQTAGSKGIVPLYAEKAQAITINAEDHAGNSSALKFFVKRDTSTSIPDNTTCAAIATNGTAFSFNRDQIKLDFPAGTFYNKTCITYDQDTAASGTIITVGDKTIPVHRYGQVALRAEGLNAKFRDKYFVAHLDEDGEKSNYGGNYRDGWLSTRTRELGAFTIGIDTVPPVIKPVQFSASMTGASRMRFRITDETPVGGDARGLRYKALVDGKWILFEYDAKNDMLTHWFDDRITPGEHKIRLTVIDDRGNTAVYEETFSR